MKKKEFFLLVVILFGASLVRLYRFSNPIADWHAWRQADTASVSRHFVTEGLDLLHPRFDDLSNVASGKNNPQGYRFVEFPIYNAVQAGLFVTFGTFTLEQWGRLVSIGASLLATLFLYLIVQKYVGQMSALFASFFFAFLPFNVYYSRTILADPSMVAAILGAIYFFGDWIDRQSYSSYLLSICLTALALLLKPFALFFTLPMVFLAFQKFGAKVFKKPQLWVFAIVCLAPLAFWRIWLLQYPEGIPASDWLFNAGNIRFKGAFFYWLFADRIGKLILGYWGIALFALGLVRKRVKGSRFFFAFLASSLLYMTVVARGNVQHDYYQILIIPTIAMFLSSGSEFLLEPPLQYFSRFVARTFLFLSILFMFAFSWYFIRDFFNVNNPSIVLAGEAVDRLTPKDAKVVAPYEGDTSFLYQTKRAGWASFSKPLAELVTMGATHLVLVNPTKNDYQIGKTYEIIAATPQYILFDLRKKP